MPVPVCDFFWFFYYVSNVGYMCVDIIYFLAIILITENTADTHDWRINVSSTLYGPVHEIAVLIASASSKGSGESAHMCADSPEPFLLAYSKYSKYG